MSFTLTDEKAVTQTKVNKNVIVLALPTVKMKQPDMYVVSLIADFFLCRHTTQVTLFVCWEIGTSDVLKQLSERGLSVSSPSWSGNVTLITNALVVPDNSGSIGAVLDTSCESTVSFLIWAIFAHIFHNRGIYWLFLYYGNWKLDNLQPSTIHQNQYINLTTSTVTIASLDCFPVIPLIRVKSLGYLHHVTDHPREVAGYWSSTLGLKLMSSISNQSEMYDLGGAVLNVTAVSPFTAQQSRQMYDWSILKLLMKILNFRLQVIESRGRFRKSTDLWLLQQLMSGQADIGASSILVTSDRVGLADFTMAIEKFKPQLYYKVQSVRAARNIYVLPFSIGVWASMCSLLLAITVALTFILRHESQLPEHELGTIFYRRGMADKTVQAKWELSEVLLVTTGAICQQGSARNPSTSAARTLFIVLFVLAVLTYTAYSASVISLLSSPSSVTSTLQGILRHGSKMGLALFNIHYYHSHFKNEDNAVSRKLHKIEVSPSFLELADGLESTLKGEVAFCADKVDAYTYLHRSHQTEDTLCSVGKIPLLQGPEYQRAFALPVSSPHTRAINFGLMRLIQFGLLTRERNRWFEVRPLCDSPEPPAGTSFISIALDDIYPVLYLVAFGLAIACLLLPFESIAHYCTRLYKKKYGGRQNLRYKWIARQKVMRMTYGAQRRQQIRAVWWVSRAWQRFRHNVANSPFPFIH